MEQCYAEFLCITRRIGLLGFVCEGTIRYKEYLGPVDTEDRNTFLFWEFKKLQQISRPRIIADTSTSTGIPKYLYYFHETPFL